MVNVYPNPSTDFVNISWQETTPQSIQLLDLSGKIVYSLSENDLFGNSAVISTTNISSGIYLLNIRTNKTIKTVKLTVK